MNHVYALIVRRASSARVSFYEGDVNHVFVLKVRGAEFVRVLMKVT